MNKKITIGILIGVILLLVSFVLFSQEDSSFESNPISQEGVISPATFEVVEGTSKSEIAKANYEPWKFNITGAETNLEPSYTILNNTATRFCIKVNDKVAYESALSLSSSQISDIPITKIDSKDNRFSLEKNTFDLTNADITDECFLVTYNEFVENMVFKVGLNSIIITSTDEGTGGGEQSWNNRVFYDQINNRWHVLNIDSNADISINTSVDGVTWEGGAVVEAGTYSYDEFDCVYDNDGTNSFLHCVYSDTTLDSLYYRRINLTGTTPFVALGNEEIPFDSSDLGGAVADDIAFPKIILDSNRCVLVAFDMRDDSEVSADEHEVVLIKEGDTCGDGDFDTADIETGFPIYSVQSDAVGYAGQFPIGINSFGDLDAQISWLDVDVAGAFQLETIFFNGTSDSVGTQQTLDVDVEHSPSWSGYDTEITNEDKVLVFAMDDATTDLDAYLISSKDGALSSQVDTTLNTPYNNVLGRSQTVSATYDYMAGGNGTVWVFAVDSADQQDIYYAKSNDSGLTWFDKTLWQDEAGTSEVKFLSANFDNDTCNVSLTWVGGASSPFTVYFDQIESGSDCEGAPVNNAPTTPILNAPANNTYFLDHPTLSIPMNWSNSSDQDGDPITYYLEIWNETSMTNLMYINTSITETTNTTGDIVTFPNVSSDDFFWRVLAMDGTDNSSWSNLWNVSIGYTIAPSNCWTETDGKLIIPPGCKYYTDVKEFLKPI